MTRQDRISPQCRRDLAFIGVYPVPDAAGGGTIRVRLDTTDEDRRRKFDRAEHLSPAVPPSDPDYQRLHPSSADAESINRALDCLENSRLVTTDRCRFGIPGGSQWR